MKLNAIVPLGTGGWIPSQTRQTTCIALAGDDRLVLLDAGTGLSRFLEPHLKELASRYSEVLIILSHFHYDHIIGLSYIPLFFEGKRVSIFGPGPACSSHRTEDVLTRALERPFFSLPLKRFPMSLSVGDLTPGLNDVAGLAVTVRVQQHSDPSIGIRIDDTVAFVTDTGCVDDTITFVRGCRVLLHDSYYDRPDYERLAASESGKADLRDHGHAIGVAEIAKRASVDRAYLIHLNPEYSPDRFREMENDARRVFPNTFVPNDMESVEP